MTTFACKTMSLLSEPFTLSSDDMFTDDDLSMWIDPSLINPEMNLPITMQPPYETHFQHSPMYSPSGSSTSPQPNVLRTSSSSPFQKNHFQQSFPNSPYIALVDANSRRQSMATFTSPGSGASGEYVSGDDMIEKHRCTFPDCGKVFKDLKAHLVTHQSLRPEKCPIPSCEYHIKGFARKYDKNRHTLTHYKGDMVCGFCTGTSKEKTFNRADVFKRHLMSVHGVEQTPPNSRKKIATSAMSSGSKLSGYPADATGKCSTCSQSFANAQDFYEHLDECVLRIVQQEDPAEAINAERLAEVENDAELLETLEKHDLPKDPLSGDDWAKDDEEMSDIEEAVKGASARISPTVTKTGPVNGIRKSKGMTHSRVGKTLNYKRKNRKNNEDNPKAWGIDTEHLVWKKRVICSFDGARRLHKDELTYHTDNEVRAETLSDGKSYVTDLDVYTLKRAEGFLDATEEEKGPWVSDDPTDEQRDEMRQIQQQKDQDTVREMFESGTQPSSG